ncbi:hypothetical protein C1X44_34835, partial [Pseudomonas sp. MPR-AND1A]
GDTMKAFLRGFVAPFPLVALIAADLLFTADGVWSMQLALRLPGGHRTRRRGHMPRRPRLRGGRGRPGIPDRVERLLKAD